MIATFLMFGFISAAAITDFRSHKIYNWTTYPGILVALIMGGVVSITGPGPAVVRYLGDLELEDRLLGLLACGGCMLICFVFFKIGGGDVKLMAMIGAFLGPLSGMEALLWTFVIGGAVGLMTLVWRVGALKLARRFFQVVISAVRLRGFRHLQGGLGAESQTSLYLAPSALLAVVLVHFRLLETFPLI